MTRAKTVVVRTGFLASAGNRRNIGLLSSMVPDSVEVSMGSCSEAGCDSGNETYEIVDAAAQVQALTIRSEVNGCLEGVLALGQIYVLASRVTDPANLFFVGLPPKDLLADVAQAWTAAGLEPNACFEAAAAVTQEWNWQHPGGSERKIVDPERWLHPELLQTGSQSAVAVKNVTRNSESTACSCAGPARPARLDPAL